MPKGFCVSSTRPKHLNFAFTYHSHRSPAVALWSQKVYVTARCHGKSLVLFLKKEKATTTLTRTCQYIPCPRKSLVMPGLSHGLFNKPGVNHESSHGWVNRPWPVSPPNFGLFPSCSCLSWLYIWVGFWDGQTNHGHERVLSLCAMANHGVVNHGLACCVNPIRGCNSRSKSRPATERGEGDGAECWMKLHWAQFPITGPDGNM